MSVKDILDKRPVFSLEVFPPKTDAGMNALCGAGGILEKLYTLRPDYISCTYNAGGANVGKNLAILDKIAGDGVCIPVTHFACAGNTRQSAKAQLQAYLEHGIDHVLIQEDTPALRNSFAAPNGAAELTGLVRQVFADRFTIAVSASPEGSTASRSVEEETDRLKRMQDSGADYITTRPCWDMDRFCRWLDTVRGAGIWLPVEAGVMPVLDQAATISMALSGSGGVMPRDLSELIRENWIYPNPFVRDPFDADAEGKKASFRESGIAYTIRQIQQYRSCGVNGIHLYTQNGYEDVACIAKEAGLISRN